MTTNPLPLDPLSAVADRFGDVLLLGAHARDHVVNVLAGLAPARRTHDLDLAVAVPDVERYRELTATFRPTSDTGMRFAIAGVPVDLIPFHPDGELGPVVEVTAGVQMDLTRRDQRRQRGADPRRFAPRPIHTPRPCPKPPASASRAPEMGL